MSDVMDTISRVFDNYSGGGEEALSLVSVRDQLNASEVARLGQLWRKAKTELRTKTREIASLKAKVLQQQEEQRELKGSERNLRLMSEANVELRDRVRFLEVELQEAKAENGRLERKYKEALTKLEESLRVVEEKGATEAELLARQQELQQRVRTGDTEREELLSKSMANLQTYEEDMERSKALLQRRQDELGRARQQASELLAERDELSRTVQHLEADGSKTREQLRQAEAMAEEQAEKAASLAGAAGREPMIRAQLQHMRMDNARLLKLLASTREYRDFCETGFAADPREKGGRMQSSFLGGPPPPGTEGALGYLGGPAEPDTALGGLGASGGGGTDDPNQAPAARWEELGDMEQRYAGALDEDLTAVVDPNSEAAHWLPTDVLRKAVSFRRKHLRHVGPEVLRDFLEGINKVWRKRYLRTTGRLRQRLGKQIKLLKRQVQHRMPYREVLQASAISRLHTELREARDVIADADPLPRSLLNHSSDSLAATAAAHAAAGTAAADLQGSGSPGYGWSAAWTRSFPASSSGGGGKATGWSRAREHGQLMEQTLKTVERLSKRVSEVSSRNRQLEAELEARSAASVPTATARQSRRDGHTRAVAWLGGKLWRQANTLADDVTRRGSMLRRAALGELTATEITEAVDEVERGVRAHRTSCRRLFEDALAAARSRALYRRIVEETQGAVRSTVPNVVERELGRMFDVGEGDEASSPAAAVLDGRASGGERASAVSSAGVPQQQSRAAPPPPGGGILRRSEMEGPGAESRLVATGVMDATTRSDAAASAWG